jgi:hypothetical protein
MVSGRANVLSSNFVSIIPSHFSYLNISRVEPYLLVDGEFESTRYDEY